MAMFLIDLNVWSVEKLPLSFKENSQSLEKNSEVIISALHIIPILGKVGQNILELTLKLKSFGLSKTPVLA